MIKKMHNDKYKTFNLIKNIGIFILKNWFENC